MVRVDKKKNVIAVLKEVINNPLASQRDIAKETGLGVGSVNRALQDLEKNGTLETPEMIDFVKLDLEVQGLATKETIRRLKEEKQQIDNPSLVRFNMESFKRSQILQNKPTEIIDGNYTLSDVVKELNNKKINPYEALAQLNELDK